MLRIIVIAGIIFGVLASDAWADAPVNSVTHNSNAAPPKLSTTPTEQIRIQLTTSNEAKLASPMAGRIIELPLKDGISVKKGSVLVRFLCDEQEARLAQAHAHVEQAVARLNGTTKLNSLGSASAVELEVEKAELSAARAEEALTQAQANSCLIKAPFDGRIANIEVKAFATVQAGEPLFGLVGDSPLEVQMIVPSRWLIWLKPGHIFTIHIDETGKSYAAVMKRIGGRMDPVTQSVSVYAELSEDAPELLAGMSGVAELSPPAEPAP